MITIDGKRYYNTAELSEMLSLHIKTVQKILREKKIKAVKVGKSYQVSEDNLKAFLNGEKQ